MSLNNGANYSNSSNIGSTHVSTKPNSRVTKILNSSEEVFQVAVIKNQSKSSPVFFRPDKRIDSPFEDMFIPANVGLREFNAGDFIPANLGSASESHIYRSRPNNPRLSSIGYLVARII